MERAPLKRKLVAVLLADVVGYSRLMGANEDDTHLRINRVMEELIEPQVTRYGGWLVRTMGDGLRVEFDSALKAVHCALAIQRGLAEWGDSAGPRDRILLRIGINTGDVIVDDQEIYGNSINIAARLEQLAEAGSVCVSAAVHDQLRDYPGLRFVDRGAHKVKNIGHPIHVFRVHDAGSAETIAAAPEVSATAEARPRGPAFRRRWAVRLGVVGLIVAATLGLSFFPNPKPGVSHAASILVLPFRNVSDDPKQEYFADAVTSDVTTDLSKVRDLAVISPATAFTYKGSDPDARRIYREIGVRYLVVGSIRRVGQQVKTNVQLVDAASGVELWADRFKNEFVDLMRLEEGITGRIAASLDLQLVQAEDRRADHTDTPDALELRLHATSLFFQSVTPEHTLAARQLLTESLQLDPNSAQAWARLAQITASDYLNHWNNTGRAQLHEAEKAVHKALLLDPNLALAHLAKGFVLRAQGDHHAAYEAFAHAIDLDPNFALAYATEGNELILIGRPNEAPPLVERAIALSPRDPSLGIFYWTIGRANFFSGRYEQAIVWLRKSVEERPNLWYNQLYLVSAYALSDKIGEAQKALAEFNRRFSKPAYTVAFVLNQEKTEPSSEPIMVAGRDKFHQGLLRAGMAEN